MTRGRVRRNGEGRGKSDLPHEAFLNCSKSLWIIENLRLSKISVIKVINKIWKKIFQVMRASSHWTLDPWSIVKTRHQSALWGCSILQHVRLRTIFGFRPSVSLYTPVVVLSGKKRNLSFYDCKMYELDELACVHVAPCQTSYLSLNKASAGNSLLSCSVR